MKIEFYICKSESDSDLMFIAKNFIVKPTGYVLKDLTQYMGGTTSSKTAMKGYETVQAT